MDRHAALEKTKYDVIWRDFPDYRDCSPGEAFVPFFFEGFHGQMRAGQTIIDFGCGTGRVAKDFLGKGLHVTLVDISPYALDEEIRSVMQLFPQQLLFIQACLWQLPVSLKPGSWIYCCDVLEHINEDFIDPVLAAMASRMRQGGYFSICLKEDLSGKAIGKPLHLTIRNRDFWERKLSKYFTIVGEDLIEDGVYFNCRVIKKEAS